MFTNFNSKFCYITTHVQDTTKTTFCILAHDATKKNAILLGETVARHSVKIKRIYFRFLLQDTASFAKDIEMMMRVNMDIPLDEPVSFLFLVVLSVNGVEGIIYLYMVFTLKMRKISSNKEFHKEFVFTLAVRRSSF